MGFNNCKPATLECAICSKVFTTESKSRKFCSVACRKVAEKRKRVLTKVNQNSIIKNNNNMEKMGELTKQIIEDIVNIEVSALMLQKEHKLESTLMSVARKHNRTRQYVTKLSKRHAKLIEEKAKELFNKLTNEK